MKLYSVPKWGLRYILQHQLLCCSSTPFLGSNEEDWTVSTANLSFQISDFCSMLLSHFQHYKLGSLNIPINYFLIYCLPWHFPLSFIGTLDLHFLRGRRVLKLYGKEHVILLKCLLSFHCKFRLYPVGCPQTNLFSPQSLQGSLLRWLAAFPITTIRILIKSFPWILSP